MNARRRRALVVLTVSGSLLAALVWARSDSKVTPPERPSDPVTVRLLSTGRHAGLLLPRRDGSLVEYGYGHWGWFAKLENEWWRAPATVLWPAQGTLGRKQVRESETAGGSYAGGTLVPFEVPRAAEDRLLARLDSEFAAAGEPIRNELYDMSFVKHPDDFWLFHDCHDEVAEWLEELGCSVSWSPIRSGLRLADPP